MTQAYVPFYALWYDGHLVSDTQYETLDGAARMAGYIATDVATRTGEDVIVHVLQCVGAVRAEIPPAGGLN